MATIEYFYTPQSPYAYLGHDRLVALAQRHGAKVALKPIDLPRVFSVSGGLPLGQRAVQRQTYRLVELERFSRFYRLPMQLKPRHFPVSGDNASRLVIAVDQALGTHKALALQGAIGKACWADEEDIADWATLARLAQPLGADGCVEAAQSAAIGEAYLALTEEAIARQVFGAPTYFVDDEMFWGQDRLDFVERKLSAHAGT